MVFGWGKKKKAEYDEPVENFLLHPKLSHWMKFQKF